MGAKRGQKKIPELPKRHLYVIYRKMKKIFFDRNFCTLEPKSAQNGIQNFFFEKKLFFKCYIVEGVGPMNKTFGGMLDPYNVSLVAKKF